MEGRAEIDALGPWFQNLHLPDGTTTAPGHPYGDFPAFKWRELAPLLPADLSGWSVLEIGCNAGFYSFELARRGADVLGLDREDLYLTQARWAAQKLGLGERVRFEKGQVHDLARTARRFDLVLFMGVFYHLRYPMLALDTLARLGPKLFVFQSLAMPQEAPPHPSLDSFGFAELDLVTRPGWPRMAFVEHRFAGDETTWWLPNAAAAGAVLRSAGFRVVARANPETFVCVPADGPPPWREAWREEEWRAATGLADGAGAAS